MKKMSLVSNTNMIVASSSSNTSDDHELPGADHDQAPEAQAPSFDICSLSAMPPYGRGVNLREMYVLESTLLNGSSTT